MALTSYYLTSGKYFYQHVIDNYDLPKDYRKDWIEKLLLNELDKDTARLVAEFVPWVTPNGFGWIEITVPALYRSRNMVAYLCPFCWSMRKKDGTPYKKSKRKIHLHGFPPDKDTDPEQWISIQHRSGHCIPFGSGEDGSPSVNVVVSNKTPIKN